MASVIRDPNGRKRISWVTADGKRPSLRLGKISQKRADDINDNIEALINHGKFGGTLDADVSKWLAGLNDKAYGRLVELNLAKSRQPLGETTLEPFIDAYIKGRTDIKPNTLIGLGQAKRNLVTYFTASKPLADITEAAAEEYWRYLVGDKKTGGVGLSPNTARRLCGRAKQFFRFAVRKRIIPGNPFSELESNVRSNPERQFFITREMADAIIDKCTDAEWRLIFALSRYGGLRCPSEHIALKWTDVLWDSNRIRVPSPKTEHIEGKASRLIPIFPELREALDDAYALADEDAEYVIQRYRQVGVNLRTQLTKIIGKAGLEPWPKLFHNLRASRQTELAESYPAHVVCAWLGNSEAVAKAHYLQVTDAHFAKASGSTGNEATQKAAHSPAIKANQASSNANPEMQNHREKPCNSEQSQNGGWPLSELNRYALAGTGF
jgi:integrase